VEDEEGEAAAGEQDISTKIHTHKKALHCDSEVMQFAIDSNTSSLLELLYTVKNGIQRHEHKKVETSFSVGSVEEISMSRILETCSVQLTCYYYYCIILIT
jgi:hypothetical protein